MQLRASKLRQLAADEGYETGPMEMLEDAAYDSVCPAICMNEGCDYTTSLEPDGSGGYCEQCGTESVDSAMIIAGVI